jgi:hypothetical protein
LDRYLLEIQGFSRIFWLVATQSGVELKVLVKKKTEGLEGREGRRKKEKKKKRC